ncbi:MAG: hypothetical protein HY903_08655 [Deltaproteobacteria bacterium]|nr:hypothetical protein [Deltaproteobacteria bacterium]
MTITRALAVALAAFLSQSGCGTKHNPVPVPGACDASQNVSYDGQIQPLFDRYCTGCHSTASVSRNGAPAGVDFDTYTDASQSAAEASTRVQADTMPPPSFGATVADSDKCLLQAWVDQGASQN